MLVSTAEENHEENRRGGGNDEDFCFFKDGVDPVGISLPLFFFLVKASLRHLKTKKSLKRGEKSEVDIVQKRLCDAGTDTPFGLSNNHKKR